jgi:hypothetical protein
MRTWALPLVIIIIIEKKHIRDCCNGVNQAGSFDMM